MNRRVAFLMISSLALTGWISGCGGKSRQSYLPTARDARGHLQTALDTWKSGAAHGPIRIASKPVINVIDPRWQAGKILESFSIIEEVEKAEQPEFKVRLKLKDEPEEITTYLVIGIDPIQVFRDVEYKQSSQTM